MSFNKKNYHKKSNQAPLFHSPKTYGELRDIPMTKGMSAISFVSILTQFALTGFCIFACIKKAPIPALDYTGVPSFVVYIALFLITWVLTFLFRFGCSVIPLDMWRFPLSVKEGIILSKGRILKLITLLCELETAICFLYISVTLFLGYSPSNIVLLIWVISLAFSVCIPCKKAGELAAQEKRFKRK